MENFFVLLLFASFVHFNAANSVTLSDQDFEFDLDRLEKGQQASPNHVPPPRPPRPPRQIIQSCDEARLSGMYELRLSSKSEPFTVFCDVESLYGKWLVFQQRVDGSVDFNRSWVEYRDGFGTVGESSEFWLGLEKIHQVTSSGNFELAIELKNKQGEYGFARYQEFEVSGKKEEYKISRLGNYRGTIGDKLSDQMGSFKTYDRYLDCNEQKSGGWWFYYCQYSLLNGPYTAVPETGNGIYWDGWTNAATFSRMMIRRKQGQ